MEFSIFQRDRVRPKDSSVAEAGEMGARESGCVAHSYFRLYIHLLRYIRTNLLHATPHLGYQEERGGEKSD